jgi:2-desacetyl-2-hydroxyethyl bacteriochlorophyllide A dehydrogenase
MKAAVLIQANQLELRDVPVPTPREGEVLVRIQAVGICGSDFSKYQGYLGGVWPVVPGHEAVGEITALGPGVTGHQVGERVAIQPNFACGTCEICLGGRENCCPQKIRMGIDGDGAFAEYAAVPARYVWRLPEGLSYRDAALTEPLAVAVHGIAKCPPTEKDRVLVYGAGAIGLFYIQLAVLAGAQVAVLDIAEPRLAVARQLGAAVTFSSKAQLEEAGGGFTLVYETSGTSDALANIVQWCVPGGRILLAGLPKEDSTFSTVLITRKELLIQGAIIYCDEFSQALDLLAQGKIRTDLFITNVCPLEELPAALADFRSPSRVKDLITLD